MRCFSLTERPPGGIEPLWILDAMVERALLTVEYDVAQPWQPEQRLVKKLLA